MSKMKLKFLVNAGLALSLITLVGGSAHAHENDRLGIEPEFGATLRAGKQTLKFELVDLKRKVVVTDTDLEITHEKKLHVFIFDLGLKEYHHVHPDFIDGRWQVEVDLARDGSYWMWAQGTLAFDGEEATADHKFRVQGGLPANPVPSDLPEMRQGTEGVSAIRLSDNPIRAKREAMIDVFFSRTDGTQPSLEPYLGAKAHVVGVTMKGDQFIHVHPMDHGEENKLMLHTRFPAAGQYRLWVQFVDGGTLRTIPLAVTVLP